MHIVQNDPACLRVAWYSGKYRPACRMSQMGGGRTTLRRRTVSNDEPDRTLLIGGSILESCDDDGVVAVECGKLPPRAADFALERGFVQAAAVCLDWG